MLGKTKRYLEVTRVLLKYNLIPELYRELRTNYISNPDCTCAFDVENRQTAVKLRQAFEELGPTFIKMGQTMSKRPDLVPQPYVIEMSNLQDKVKPVPFEEMAESLDLACICEYISREDRNRKKSEEELKAERERRAKAFIEIFDSFDTDPIACGSIAQVYKGVLDGKTVAVKILRPNLIDTINIDLSILDDFKPVMKKVLRVGKNFDIDAFLLEIREMLTREVDLRIEAVSMRRFEDNFKNVKNVAVPKIYPDYCSANVLTMEFIQGTQVKDIIDMQVPQSKKSEYTRTITKSYLKQVYIDGFYHADPHGGNMLVEENDTVAFIDFGAVGSIDDELKKNMLEFYYAINNRDVEGATQGFLRIGGADPREVDLRRLRKDMDELIANQNYGLEGRQSDNYAKLGLKYDIRLPGEFSTLQRAILLIEGVCLELDSRYNIKTIAIPVLMDAYKKLNSPKGAALHIEFSAEPMNEKAELKAAIREVADKMEYMGDRFLEGKQKENKRSVFSKEFFLAVLLVVSTYILLNGDAFSWVGLIGFVGTILIALLSVIRGN
ncbi:ubiquinone biosynthesis protein [Methanosarcina sp. 2.H.T.1A.6]|uniref:ABC1 kinase family protein n=1 Tax=unclassified Methanosarcina TaxID=2644672 RepID=UPI0006214ACB|nr:MULTISPECIES: AarF/ABC1/UbiB kinase family protein [unclassified Methanosarcina]KKG15079.1 ubiquinone biosynthesis protein [Methanosarcina sp. 2.H.T.1A.3]KKG19342.1 ubiquinone biosynthesis protein [Methanosarcina sp. 2.H.T.1A.15]KKG20778.1 ubiquinone biosynthesis protein [Methanosarcina sp. 2.H.T.1A.8]KKG22095.1 ubiquinone biosynthesis protein [Methanosarcina sp. 2.H.T.1A.6]